jgi:hypothetical protein
MADIVTLAELKTKARITGSTNDAELTQIIAEVEAKFQGEIGQNLISAAYTEVRTGDGSPTMQLYRYPIVALSSIAIENEDNVTLMSDQVRCKTGAGSDGIVYLLRRYFTAWYPQNITVTYVAGFTNQAAVKAAMPDAWELVLDSASQYWFDITAQQKGVQSQAYMDGSISYFGPQFKEKKFQERWKQVVDKYRRRLNEAVPDVY